MEQRTFDLIAFDGDDTLWHNERSYREARERFRHMLAKGGVTLSDEEIEQRVSGTEIANLEYYGYGVSSFVLSLIETAIELTQGKVTTADIRALTDLAKQMLREDIELFPGAAEAVATLAESYPLALVTKGDLLHQTSKLDRSGLRRHFRFVEVVSHKTPAAYADILARHGVDASRFMMVGNSLKSDVLPVIELGGWAVHVPAAVSWFYEHADLPDDGNSRYVELETLERLPSLVENLDILERTSSF